MISQGLALLAHHCVKSLSTMFEAIQLVFDYDILCQQSADTQSDLGQVALFDGERIHTDCFRRKCHLFPARKMNPDINRLKPWFDQGQSRNLEYTYNGTRLLEIQLGSADLTCSMED